MPEALSGQSAVRRYCWQVVSANGLPEGGVRIRVADDGPGVPRNLRKRIFDAGFSTITPGMDTE